MASINDADVQLYLDELKAFVFQFGNTTNTGTENLVELLNFILTDIEEIQYLTEDKLEILYKRQNTITNLLSSYDVVYKDSLIEERYLSYKEDNMNISVNSNYMYNVMNLLDTTMKDKITDLSDMRYESGFLNVSINGLNDTLTSIANLKTEINDLITKCQNT